MPQRNIEIVRLLLDAWREVEAGRALVYMSEDVTFDTSTRPDGKVWQGPQGVSDAIAEWFDVWDEHRLDAGELLEAADGRVVLPWSESGTAKHSGARISQDGATVFTLTDGLVSAMVVTTDREGALAMLGLTSAGE